MKDDSMPELSLSRAGPWEDVVELSEDIGSLLRSVGPEDVNGEISKEEFEALSKEWEKWRPRAEDDFSGEMREKTAKKSSIGKSELEEGEGAKNTGKSMARAAKDSLDRKVRRGVRSLEEKIYENIILKANSLYFDGSALDVVLSKNWRSNSSDKYRLTLHSDSPHLRKFFANRIDWDDR